MLSASAARTVYIPPSLATDQQRNLGLEGR